MIILDTQVLSQLQRPGSRDEYQIKEKFGGLTDQDIRITIINPFEQLKSVLGKIHLSRQASERDLPYFTLLSHLLGYYSSSWKGRILPFDQVANVIFQSFDPKLVHKIKSMDARIAAIALANRGTLISSNVRDFEAVPGPSVENWSTT